MKKFLALILAVLMIAGSVVSVSAAFEDVSADHKHAKAIEELQVQKVVAGKTETTFAPDELVTRWQMALFMARATSGKTDDANWENGAALFTDCTQYLGAIQYCFVKGIIKGVTATEFAPDANITLRDGVIMAVRALGYEKADDGLTADAKKYNVTGTNYWLPYYQTGSELGLLENLETVAVTKELTRAETAQLIYNMLYTEVYVGADVDKSYTLNDVAFGGMKIVEVENVTGAWICETPTYRFESSDTIPTEDYETVMIQPDVKTESGDDFVDAIEVPLEDLAVLGITAENVDDYFGAYVELVNCDADEDDEDYEIDYATYETITSVDNDNKTAVTGDDITVVKNGDGKIKIGKKTHYANTATTNNAKKTNYIQIFAVDCDEDNEVDEITLTEKTASYLDGALYDAVLYDVDKDGYYEYALVYKYNLAQYDEPNVRGAETCGVMKGYKDVTYSEELAEDDVFVYTFDPFTLTVDVKEVLEMYTGTIKGYSEKTEDDVKVGYIKIDTDSYKLPLTYNPSEGFFETCDSGDLLEGVDLADITPAELKATAKANVGETYEYYVFNNKILAFGDKLDEEESVNYAVVGDFTDFELYDYVLLNAYIDGVETEIKVNKVQTPDTVNGGWDTSRVSKLGYKALTKLLDEIGGVYTYTVDEDGYYTIKKQELKYTLGELGIPTTNGMIRFEDYDEVSASTRGQILRINASTQIFMIDTDENTVTPIKTQTGKVWFIHGVDAQTKVYVDKLGFGDTTLDNSDRGIPNYGITSVIYLQTSKNPVNADEYKLVFVDADLTDYDLGTADEFGLVLDEEDEDEDEDTSYIKYDAEDSALNLTTFAGIDEIYLEEGVTVDDLAAGVYLLDSNNIVIGSKALADLATDGSYGITIEDSVQALFKVLTINAGNIDLYGYKNVVVSGLSDQNTGVKTVTFMDYVYWNNQDAETGLPASTDSDYEEGFDTVKKSNADLVKYLTNNYANGAKVLVAANGLIYFDQGDAYNANTIRGIILNDLLAH